MFSLKNILSIACLSLLNVLINIAAVLPEAEKALCIANCIPMRHNSCPLPAKSLLPRLVMVWKFNPETCTEVRRD